MSERPLSRQERRRLERIRAKALARQPYIAKQLAAIATDPALTMPGAVTIGHVFHDAWCPRLSGGLCRCNPDLTFEPVLTPPPDPLPHAS
ncbi:MAG: hypothetical protein M3Q71_22430 [Chloroflexota bacterium]|nr:hypothetical protein [Chloroflexota bacterium]